MLMLESTHMQESCRTYRCVVTHIRMCHATGLGNWTLWSSQSFKNVTGGVSAARGGGAAGAAARAFRTAAVSASDVSSLPTAKGGLAVGVNASRGVREMGVQGTSGRERIAQGIDMYIADSEFDGYAATVSSESTSDEMGDSMDRDSEDSSGNSNVSPTNASPVASAARRSEGRDRSIGEGWQNNWRTIVRRVAKSSRLNTKQRAAQRAQLRRAGFSSSSSSSASSSSASSTPSASLPEEEDEK